MSNDTVQTGTQGDRIAEARAQAERNRAVNRRFALWAIAIILLIAGFWYFWTKGNGSSSSVALSCFTGCSDAQFASAISAHEERLDADDVGDKAMAERVAKLEKQFASRGPADLGRVRLDVYTHDPETVVVASGGGSKKQEVKKPEKKTEKKKADSTKEKPADKKVDKKDTTAEDAKAEAQRLAAAEKQRALDAEEQKPQEIICKTGFLGTIADDDILIIGMLTNLSVEDGTEDWFVYADLKRFQATRVISPGYSFTKACYPVTVPKRQVCVNPMIKGDATNVAVDANTRIKTISDPEYAIDEEGNVVNDVRVGFAKNDNAIKLLPLISSYKRVKMNGTWCAIVPYPNT